MRKLKYFSFQIWMSLRREVGARLRLREFWIAVVLLVFRRVGV